MMTISDNVATDAVIRAVGLDGINEMTARLGLMETMVVDDLQSMLDGMASETGFGNYAALIAHDPRADGPPSNAEVPARLARPSALDPAPGSRTTPADMIRRLSLI